MNKILFALSFLFVGATAHAVEQVHMYSVRTTDAFQTSATQFVKSGATANRQWRVWVDNTDMTQATAISVTGFALATTTESATKTIAASAKYLRISVQGSSTDYAKVNFVSAANNALNNCMRSYQATPIIIEGNLNLDALTAYIEVSSPAVAVTITSIR